MLGLAPKWVRLAPNGTNPGLFQMIFQCIWRPAHDTQLSLTPGISVLDPNRIILTANWTNWGLLNIIFSTFWFSLKQIFQRVPDLSNFRSTWPSSESQVTSLVYARLTMNRQRTLLQRTYWDRHARFARLKIQQQMNIATFGFCSRTKKLINDWWNTRKLSVLVTDGWW